MTRVERAVATFLATLGICIACDSGGGAGGETHWLGACETDADCGGGQCLCGVCTRVCKADGDCAGRSRRGECFETASPGLATRCAGASPKVAPGICLATCSGDADCPARERCLLGACVPTSQEVDAATAKDAGPSTGETATKYVHVDAGASFGDPVEVPEPRTTLEGAESLVGTWAQLNADGSPCSSDNYDDPRNASVRAVCAHLEITRDDAGGIVGHLYYLERNPPSNSFPAGPFPPASDGSSGYPTGVDPKLYGNLHDNAAGVRYRVLDGVFDGKSLQFWYSPLDLWTDWCAMQTPYPFQLDGVRGYRCVPSDATEENTDQGKFALCTSALDFGVCESAPGVVIPCICKKDGGLLDLACRENRTACSCNAKRCRAGLRADAKSWKLGVSGDTMTEGFQPAQLVLKLVSP